MDVPDKPDWDDREEAELVLPFTNVESVGGEYEDDAFVAGFQMGQIHGKLEDRRIAAATFLIFKGLEKQVDLIAMLHGYTTDVLHQDDDWMQIGVTRNEEN